MFAGEVGSRHVWMASVSALSDESVRSLKSDGRADASRVAELLLTSRPSLLPLLRFATFPYRRSSPLCGRNHCRLAQTAVESMQGVVCCTIKSVPKSSVFLCRLSLRVGGRAAPSPSMKFNTLSLFVSPTEFSLFIYFFSPDKMTSAC